MLEITCDLRDLPRENEITHLLRTGLSDQNHDRQSVHSGVVAVRFDPVWVVPNSQPTLPTHTDMLIESFFPKDIFFGSV